MGKLISIKQHNEGVCGQLATVTSLFQQLRRANIPVLSIRIEIGLHTIRTAYPVRFAGIKPLSTVTTPTSIKTRTTLQGCVIEWSERRGEKA